MQISVAICDDQQDSLAMIHKELVDAANNLDIDVETYPYTDGERIVELICDEKENFDILFLDIDMPNISGLEVAEKIRKSRSDVILIFISAHEQYVFESIKYRPYRYIRKNKMKQEIMPALKSAYNFIMSEIRKGIIVKTDDGEVKLKHTDIMYFEINARKLKIYTGNGREYISRKTVKEFHNELCDDDFVQIHSGCVVNTKYIKEYSGYDITLDNGKRLIVSRRRIKDVKTKVLKYWRDRV